MTADNEAMGELCLFYNGANLDQKSGTAAYLITMGSDGWPHSAMISAGELLLEHSGARLAIWASSRTSENLARSGRALILVILSELSIRARLQLESRGRLQAIEGLHGYAGTVTSASSERASYATLSSPVSFDLHHREATLARWQRTHEALRLI
jgi:hypothetical protein